MKELTSTKETENELLCTRFPTDEILVFICFDYKIAAINWAASFQHIRDLANGLLTGFDKTIFGIQQIGIDMSCRNCTFTFVN